MNSNQIDGSMHNSNELDQMYQMIRENRMAMYSSPRRYYNRDGSKGSALKFLFFIEAIIFFMLCLSASVAFGQSSPSADHSIVKAETTVQPNISNYQAVYNSGKIFLSWTTYNEPDDCIYIIERSEGNTVFQSVGVKEGIGSELELFYSWVDQTPPPGYAYYRIKKITKDGQQMYSSISSVINQGSSYNENVNFVKGGIADEGQK
ncbi:MAG TPA: hypothetical protein PKH65_00010 [Bacteroidia bacterium]|nr:hypothetical protein [Bacteroidia bacterium]HNT79037.1 hypothetical protein [Bacteroidia bacterium]